MHLRQLLVFLIIVATIATTVPTLLGQEFYSYVDESGVQVFTNIPPITGRIPSSQDNVQEYGHALRPEKLQSSVHLPEGPEIDPDRFDTIINKYASYYSLDPYLIHSIIETESGFNPNAVSQKGACGLMQLMPATAERLGVRDTFDPEQNIQAGVRHFRSLMDIFGNDLNLSLAAYNAGENLVRRLGRVPQYKETIDYVRSVTRRYEKRRQTERAQEENENLPTFRYVDTSGVLHLTNIPPTR